MNSYRYPNFDSIIQLSFSDLKAEGKQKFNDTPKKGSKEAQ